MKAKLAGLHRVRAKGRTYYYAWRGGPRIHAEFGTPEFLVEFTEAHKAKPRRAGGETFETLVDRYLDSAEFKQRSASTKASYRRYLALAVKEFGDASLDVLQDPKMRGEIKDWRDTLAATPRTADYAWTCVARVLSFAKDRGRIGVNVCERGGRLYSSDRKDKIWTEADLAKLFAVASREVSLVVAMALWTGQRQGDLLTLPWSAYVNRTIRLRQSKGGVRVSIPVRDTLAGIIALIPKRGPVMLTSSTELPWTGDGFRASFNKACERAEITGLTFHDLRGTAVTRLALSGSTESEIAAITGHSIGDVRSILDRHYLSRDVELAEEAMRKRERKEKGTNAVKQFVKRSARSGGGNPEKAE
ncbi:tyrosine-type recombinase/integrase [Alsobacter sp. R-9]